MAKQYVLECDCGATSFEQVESGFKCAECSDIIYTSDAGHQLVEIEIEEEEEE